MSLLTLEAKLERQDSTTPWGFRMQGGKDFSSPISIARVSPGSLAAKCGLLQGDLILKIGSKSSDTLKHKDAQDTIVSYGNKLDLLLQRGGAPSYETFSAPNISSYQTPAGPAAPGNVSYNAAPKPFGSAPNKAPAPYVPAPAPYTPAVDNVTQQTQNLNIKPDYAKYQDVDDKPGPASHQSRSFKFLRDTLDSGQEAPPALLPTVDLRRSPSPHVPPTTLNSTSSKYNSPAGLYSSANLPNTATIQAVPAPDSDGSSNTGDDERPLYDDQGKRLYRPSETYKLIHEHENEKDKPGSKVPEHSRTFKVLEKSLGNNNNNNNNSEDVDESDSAFMHVKAAKVVICPSETYQLVHQHEHGPLKTETHVPEQSYSFRQLERQLGEPGPPAPPKAPAAPKPGVWSPGQKPTDQAPSSKPFVPSVQAPPPKTPSKPTGVGAVRGKIGDAVIKSAGPAGPTERVPVCHSCGSPIRGPFVLAMGKSWCPDHFICANPRCGVKLVGIGFIEEGGFLYCEKDYELYFAPHCAKCDSAIIGECVNALSKQYHPACFLCYHCKTPIGGNQFHLEEGKAYCENDWRQMFQTMCSACNFPIEPGDKWVEALNTNFHSECFNCSTCQVNLEGQAFYAKTGKPYCKKHAR